MGSGRAPAIATAASALTGHPKGLYYLAFTAAWERFSYYGMTALLGGHLALAFEHSFLLALLLLVAARDVPRSLSPPARPCRAGRPGQG